MTPVMPLTPLLPLLLALASPGALAQEVALVSDRGVEYLEIESIAGTVIRSRVAVAYWVGAAAQEVSGVETIHLHRDCSAQSSLLGEGSWERQDGGFAIHLLGDSVRFLDQDPPASLGRGCGDWRDLFGGRAARSDR